MVQSKELCKKKISRKQEFTAGGIKHNRKERK